MNLTLSDGCTLYYLETGRGAPVVLIHGTAARLWGPTVAALAVERRVIEYDRRSFGESAHPPLADTSRHAADAAELIERIAHGPALVVGWSMGGVIALELASWRPELVTGLVLLEPPFLAKTSPTRHLLLGVAGAIVLGMLGWPRQGASMFLRAVMRHRDGTQGWDRLSPRVRDSMLANAAAICREVMGGTGEHLTAEQIRRVTVPIELLLGRLSARDFELAAERLHRQLPQTQVHWVEGADHSLQLDAPAVAAAVARVAGRSR